MGLMIRAKTIRRILFASIAVVVGGCATTSAYEEPVAIGSGTPSRIVEIPEISKTEAGRSLLEVGDPNLNDPTRDIPQQPAVHKTPLRSSDFDSTLEMTLRPTIIDLWDDYTRFDYEDVIEGASRLTAQVNRPSWERATALLLAGASSYLLGDAERALSYFIMARETDTYVGPDPDQFPAAVIQLYNRASGR